MLSALMSKWRLSAVVLLAVVFCVLACSPSGTRGPSRGQREFSPDRSLEVATSLWRDSHFTELLNLSEEQFHALWEADMKFRLQRHQIQSQVDDYNLQMQKTISANASDREGVLWLARKVAELKGELIVQEVEARLVVKEVLTADQYKKWEQRNARPGFAEPGGPPGAESGGRRHRLYGP